MKNELFDIDTLGKIMDDFLKKNDIQLLVELPEGTLEPKLTDNTMMGPAIQLYILTAAIGPVIRDIWNMTKKDGSPMMKPGSKEKFVDDVLKLVKKDILEDKK